MWTDLVPPSGLYALPTRTTVHGTPHTSCLWTARAEAKTADKDFTQGYLHGRCRVAMTNDVRHQPFIRVVLHDTPKERAWPSDADRQSV